MVRGLTRHGIAIVTVSSIPHVSHTRSLSTLDSVTGVTNCHTVIRTTRRFKHFFAKRVATTKGIPPTGIVIVNTNITNLTTVNTTGDLNTVIHTFSAHPRIGRRIRDVNTRFLRLSFGRRTNDNSNCTGIVSSTFVGTRVRLFTTRTGRISVVIAATLVPNGPTPGLVAHRVISSVGTNDIVISLTTRGNNGYRCAIPNRVFAARGNIGIVNCASLPNHLPARSSRLCNAGLIGLLGLLYGRGSNGVAISFSSIIVHNIAIVHTNRVA